MHPVDALAVPAAWLLAGLASILGLVDWLRSRRRNDPNRRSDLGPALDELREIHVVSARRFGKDDLHARLTASIEADPSGVEGRQLLKDWVDSREATEALVEQERRSGRDRRGQA